MKVGIFQNLYIKLSHELLSRNLVNFIMEFIKIKLRIQVPKIYFCFETLKNIIIENGLKHSFSANHKT